MDLVMDVPVLLYEDLAHASFAQLEDFISRASQAGLHMRLLTTRSGRPWAIRLPLTIFSPNYAFVMYHMMLNPFWQAHSLHHSNRSGALVFMNELVVGKDSRKAPGEVGYRYVSACNYTGRSLARGGSFVSRIAKSAVIDVVNDMKARRIYGRRLCTQGTCPQRVISEAKFAEQKFAREGYDMPSQLYSMPRWTRSEDEAPSFDDCPSFLDEHPSGFGPCNRHPDDDHDDEGAVGGGSRNILVA